MKFRSYNEELLIAAALMTDLFNDVVIERRRHGLDRDYSKAILIEDIFQKNIDIPCVIGDRSAVLKSLENYEGAFKLPIFVLENKGLKVDEQRIADLHYDMLYQPDRSMQLLPVNNPHYKPYDIRKRRPVPVNIDYTLTMIAKYKEDLDQMITNWIVHFRPDVYVKWYHPRFRIEKYTIESQVIGGQSVNYKPPEESNINKVYQYIGDTSFSFKTWLFTGLDYGTDLPSGDIGIIKYFNWFPTELNTTDVSGMPGYPVIGEPGVNPAGFYAVPNHMEFENDGSDNIGLSAGKYFANNIGGYPTSAFPSGPIINIKNTDVDVFTKDVWEMTPKWEIYQDYCTVDFISNERFGIKFIYFHGAYPASSWNVDSTNPSGDYLLQTFISSDDPSTREKLMYTDVDKNHEFGICFTDSLSVNIDYNFEKKILILSGYNTNNRYSCSMYSKISTLSTYGIEQGICIQNNMSLPEHDINISLIKKFNTNYEKLPVYCSILKNIKLLNSDYDNIEGWKHNLAPVKFIIETPEYKKKINNLQAYILQYWDEIEIMPCNYEGKPIDSNINEELKFYKLTSNNQKFLSGLELVSIDKINGDLFLARKEFTVNNKEYTLIVNKQLYFVLSDDDIYDWGIILIPKFAPCHAPIFQVTIPNGQLTYGLGMHGNVSPCIEKNML